MKSSLILTFVLIVASFTPASAREQVGVEDFAFQSHGVTMSGAVMAPKSSVPIAAFVLVHGSGKVERMTGLARLLASEGFLVLTYDKRGVGKSGGDYEGADNVSAANLNLLADDAAAGFEALRDSPRAKNIPMGFVGISQAGWIIPLAAMHTNSDFVALWSGPVCSVSEQLHFQALAASDNNFWETHTAEQVADYMRSTHYRLDDTDPAKMLSHIDAPGLWLFGGRDNLMPVDLSVRRLQKVIAQGRNNFAYKIFPNESHNLADRPDQESYQYMVSWLRGRTKR